MFLADAHTPPFIPSTYSLRMRERMLNRIYILRKLYVFIFCREFYDFRRFLRIFWPFEGVYPAAFSEIWSFGLRVACCRESDRAGLSIAISYDREPFYLTGDKSARLALIEPLENIKREEPRLGGGDGICLAALLSFRQLIQERRMSSSILGQAMQR